MDLYQEVKEEEHFLKNIFNRFRSRDFSGDAGQAMKNSTFQLSSNLIMKFGSLLFTLILARLLQPERMGLYTLALSTILLFSTFSDLGIGSAVLTYLSKALGEDSKKKAKGYFKKLLSWKIKLILIAMFILLVGSYFISEYYYKKPIFFGVLIGVLYIPIVQIIGFLEAIFKAKNNFKIPMIKDTIFQILRLVAIPLYLFVFFNVDTTNKILVMNLILIITLCHFIAFLFLFFKAKKISFLNLKEEKLKKDEIKDLKKFIVPLTATAFAGTFFGYIDTLMLGRYVASEFLAFYGAAFSLIGSAGAIIGFVAVAVMPIFSRKSGKDLENMFRKTRNFTLLISILSAIFTYFAAWWIIRIAYGSGYLAAVPVLKWFSILLVFITMIGIYSSYFVSQKRTKVVSALLIISTVLNIIFNITFIQYGLKVAGEIGGVYGAVAATILSRFFYFAGLVIWKGKK